MTKQSHRRMRDGRLQALSAVGLLVAGALGFGVLDATSANADPTVHTIVQNVPEHWAPYLSGGYTDIIFNGTNITISCYLTGDSVTGPYGAENVWDLVSGGNGYGVEAGTFVPDADVYTGSNSPIVPRCSTALGTIIGNNPVNIYNGPGPTYTYEGAISVGEKVEVKCYSTGSWVNGPFGAENLWDLLTPTYGGPTWVPDALVYTGSNSAVVPHC